LLIFKRDPVSNELTFQKAIETKMSMDNVKFDAATNKIYSGGVARTVDATKFHAPYDKHFPGAHSMIIEIDVSKEEN